MLTLAEAGIGANRLEALRDAALGARPTNYSPYSGFVVIAAVETENGVFGGSNIEVVNYSLTKHAEETALLAAISGGAGPSGGWAKVLYVSDAPCGSCRQFLYEFGSRDTLVIVDRLDQDAIGTVTLDDLGAQEPSGIWRLPDLLPGAFGTESLGRQGLPKRL